MQALTRMDMLVIEYMLVICDTNGWKCELDETNTSIVVLFSKDWDSLL